MNERVWLLLAFMRGATERNIPLSPDVFGLFCDAIGGVTMDERREVGEILKADAREQFVNSPNFGEFNDALNALR